MSYVGMNPLHQIYGCQTKILNICFHYSSGQGHLLLFSFILWCDVDQFLILQRRNTLMVTHTFGGGGSVEWFCDGIQTDVLQCIFCPLQSPSWCCCHCCCFFSFYSLLTLLRLFPSLPTSLQRELCHYICCLTCSTEISCGWLFSVCAHRNSQMQIFSRLFL